MLSVFIIFKEKLKNNMNITFHYMIRFLRIKFSNYLLTTYSILDTGLVLELQRWKTLLSSEDIK